jgi:pSer/pThr/pTyr-binding forkhead associated (FHA) protein
MKLKLLVVRGEPAGKALVFNPGDYYLGRGPECQVRLKSDWVSRQHCLLRVGEGQAQLRDLGSRNGTLLNGALLVEERGLVEGDQVQIGPVVFEVRYVPPDQGVRPVPEPPEAPEPDEEPRLDSTEHHPALLPAP